MFFFQEEDGIRDIGVTGVQTCALPILSQKLFDLYTAGAFTAETHSGLDRVLAPIDASERPALVQAIVSDRSEERRVGKECRSRLSAYHLKNKEKCNIYRKEHP